MIENGMSGVAVDDTLDDLSFVYMILYSINGVTCLAGGYRRYENQVFNQ